MVISEETYLEMKKLIAEYESNQLNKDSISEPTEQPYVEVLSIKINRKYNPKYGDNRKCKCGHSYYRHFDSYEEMAVIGCKYCECFYFEEVSDN